MSQGRSEMLDRTISVMGGFIKVNGLEAGIYGLLMIIVTFVIRLPAGRQRDEHLREITAELETLLRRRVREVHQLTERN